MSTYLYAYQNHSVNNTLSKRISEVQIVQEWQGIPQEHNDNEVSIRVSASQFTEAQLQTVNYFAVDPEGTGHLRYYYLTSLDRNLAGMHTFNGSLDVLMTYQDTIRQLNVLAARSTSHGNTKIPDELRRITPVIGKRSWSIEGDNTLVPTPIGPNLDVAVRNGYGTYVLVTSQSGYTAAGE